MTIRSNVIAMAPNHPFSGHWPSTRRLHGLFKYLGGGRFTLLEKDNEDISEVEEIDTEKITAKELEKYNGKNGNSTYVAYQGKVYDLSKSSLWSSGEHMGIHQAGKDITEGVNLAPHGEEVLKRKKVKLVGKLV